MFQQSATHLKQENEDLKAEIKEYRQQVSSISTTALNSKSAVVNVSKTT